MRASALCLALLALVACDRRAAPRAEEYEGVELAAEVMEELEPPDPNEPPPPAIGEPPSPTVRARVRDRPPPVLPAHPDTESAATARVSARRYVYRVRMIVPAGLGDSSDRIARPSAELFVDVSHDRLRARFSGSGWPVGAGSEVRLRSDRHGVYLFDGEGGRPLEPRELAAWFEGGVVRRRGPPLRIYPAFGVLRRAPVDEDVPGALVCALLAELAGEPREEALMRRCERGAPHLFRFGFWRAEQTADVPVSLPRSALRADELDPPPPVLSEPGRAFLEPSGLRRLSPSRPPPADAAPLEDGEGLSVVNDSAARVVVTIEGIAAGWVDAGERMSFVGLRPGSYEVGAIRPLGAVVARGPNVTVPGTFRVCDGPCPRQ